MNYELNNDGTKHFTGKFQKGSKRVERRCTKEVVEVDGEQAFLITPELEPGETLERVGDDIFIS